MKGINIPARYDGNALSLQSLSIKAPLLTKLEKLKRTNPEAYFYWYQTYELMRM